MNWREAVQAMLDGKKVTNVAWEDSESIYLHWPLGVEGPVWSSGTFYTYIAARDSGWEIYEEPTPKINLGPEHVGKRVKLRNGDISLITDYELDDETFHSSTNLWKSNGQYSDMHNSNFNFDIVEILD